LYLWHFPVILSVYQRGPQMLPPRLDHLWLRVALIMGLSVGLAAASYRLIEQPAMAYARARTRRWLERGRDTAPDAPAPAPAR
jgi:peptidoglycan/LPS O-acetylase OafA/YrhL